MGEHERVGRVNDPRRTDDVPPLRLLWRKTLWRAVAALGPRRLVPRLYPEPTICYYDIRRYPGVNGMAAFTIDDAFCGPDNPGGSMLPEVLDLLGDYNAKATFFVTAEHMEGVSAALCKRLLRDGHELANHCTRDRAYDRDDRASFEADVQATNDLLAEMGSPSTRWFRAPMGKANATMLEVIEACGLKHVMLDCYGQDTEIPDPQFIADLLLRYVTSGSIFLIHMPERGMREWNFDAMEQTLAGLPALGLRPVTMGMLADSALLANGLGG